MGYTKEQYEEQINSAIVFSIDRSNNSVLWETETRKLLVLTIEYYKDCVMRKETFENYAVELFESIQQSIRSFSPDKGTFLHYVNVAVKHRIDQKKLADTLDQQRQGMSVSAKDNQLIRKMLSFARSKGYNVNDRETQERIAAQFNVPVSQVRFCVEQSQIKVFNETISDEEGEESSIFDKIAAAEPSAEQSMEDREKQFDLIRRIDVAFRTCQERQKPLLSRLLTAKLIPAIDLNDDTLLELETVSFIDKPLMKEYLSGMGMPSARQIAEEYGTSEQSVSRTYKTFLEKVPRKG